METLLPFVTSFGGPIAAALASLLIGAWTAWHAGRWVERRALGEARLDEHLRECGEASREVQASLSRLHQRLDSLSKQVARLEGKLEGDR